MSINDKGAEAPDDTNQVIEAAATETPVVEAAAEQTPEEAALAAMDEGIAAETPEPVKAEPVEPEAAESDAEKPGAAKKPEAKAEEPKPNETTEAEITELGLKEKSAARFRELANSANEYAQAKDALKAAGIEDVSAFVQQVPQLVQRSKDFEDLVGMVSETGASPEQYDNALAYLGDFNRAMQGDVTAAKRAFELWKAQGPVFAGILGVDVGQGVDPLAEHADLARDVENGDLSRERALEIAAARTQGKMGQAWRERSAQTSAQEQARTAGVQALNTLEAQLAAKDPNYAARKPYLLPAVKRIVAAFPPDKWAEEAAAAYAEIPALPEAPKPVAVKPPPGPMRASGPRPNLTPTTDDPMEAMEMGIAAAG